ncbi:unnamed protein product [marine sediment metagenome]|uniref:Uncharacterized protein n=1 Tax=marine sediment metagenome TaxID=412755 RepID=X0YEE2_9ZZZZ
MCLMAKKETSPCSKSKEAHGNKPEKTTNEDYNRDFIIQELITAAGGDGMAKIGALKELRSMLSEEQPDEDLEVDIAFVPIVFDDENFVASMAEAVEI